MVRQRRSGTGPEVAIRRLLHARGLRYRINFRAVTGTTRSVDVAFTRARVAVDVRGCYWHGCPVHGTAPSANARWWADKLRANRERDLDTERRLRDAGWHVVIAWEHEEPAAVVERIAAALAQRAARSTRHRGVHAAPGNW